MAAGVAASRLQAPEGAPGRRARDRLQARQPASLQVDPAGVAGMREYMDRFWSDALAAFESAARTQEKR